MLIMDVEPKIALKQTLVKESLLNPFQLSTLTPDFYLNIVEYINSSNEKTQLMSLLQTIRSKRKSKIQTLAASSIPSNQIEGKLTIDELELFRIWRQSSQDHDLMITKPVPELVGDRPNEQIPSLESFVTQ